MEEWMDIRPHWMVRKGNFLLSGLLCCFLLCSMVIPYPDVVEGPIRLEGASGLLLVSEKESRKIRSGQEVLVRPVGENRAGIRGAVGAGPWINKGADSLWVRVEMPQSIGEGRSLEGTVMTEDGSLFKHILGAVCSLWIKKRFNE